MCEQLAIDLHGCRAKDVLREHSARHRIGTIGHDKRGIETFGVLAETGMHASRPEALRRRHAILVVAKFNVSHFSTPPDNYR